MYEQLASTSHETLVCQRYNEKGPACHRVTSDTVMLVCEDCGDLAIKVGLAVDWIH